jgi:dGTPase
MDWADDVAYSVHDLEDGLHAGMITFRNLQDHAERSVVAALAATTYCAPDVTVAELDAVFDGLLAIDAWPSSFDRGPASLAALKNLTSDLIGRFCVAAQEATRAAHAEHANPNDPTSPTSTGSPISTVNITSTVNTTSPDSTANPGSTATTGGRFLTRYAADLVVPRTQRLECALLKAVTHRYVMSRAGVAAAQARERDLIAELAEAVEQGAPATLDPLLRPAWAEASSDAARRRVVIDHIASLTDTSAIAHHTRLCR